MPWISASRSQSFIKNPLFPLGMAFSRRFPRDVKGSSYPVWEEVYLSTEEEQKLEHDQRQHNIALMRECIADAKKIFFEEKLKDFQSDVIQTAIALFGQRSRHAVYWKEESVKEKFDKAYRRE